MHYRTLIRTVVYVLVALSAYAASEWVYLYKIMDDSAVVVRENGDVYQIEKGIGCISLWRFKGKPVLISSPGFFLGFGSELVLPDANQKCRIWDSSQLGSIGDLAVPLQNQLFQQSFSCEDGHWIMSILGNGAIIQLEDGSIWQIDSIDSFTSSMWFPLSNINICGSYLINTDNGEKVSVLKSIKNPQGKALKIPHPF